jgi:phage tail-like protein
MASPPSEYLKYLPQIFRAGAEGGFLDGYLKVFEALLSGRADAASTGVAPSLEGTIDALPTMMDPGLTPVDEGTDGVPPRSEFLDYLARWVALTFDENWGLDKRREWLRRIVPLYKRRGTLAGLREYVAMFTGRQSKVEELPRGFVVGSKPNATVGVNSFISGAPAYFFRVRMNYGYPPEPFYIDEWKNLRHGTRAIVDLEKPAHTYYTLHARTPGIIVGGANHGGPKSSTAPGKGRATVGRDTLIWQESKQVGV